MNPRATIVLSFLLLAIVSLGQASWIQTKAWTAQWLLERAWQRAQTGAEGARPWAWADTEPIARLHVPKTDTHTLVLSRASGRTLAFGPAHLAGTAPLGRPGNSVITGHRDTHFRFLEQLHAGDRLEIDLPNGRRATYRVQTTAVAHTDDIALDAAPLRSVLTLITCYPFNALDPGGPWRYLVVAVDDSRPPSKSQSSGKSHLGSTAVALDEGALLLGADSPPLT